MFPCGDLLVKSKPKLIKKSFRAVLCGLTGLGANVSKSCKSLLSFRSKFQAIILNFVHNLDIKTF